VARDDQRCVAVAASAPQQLEHVRRGFRVEVARWLVGEHQLRRVNHGAGDRDALLLAARDILGEALGTVREPELREQGGPRAPHRIWRDIVQREGQLDVFGDRQCRYQVERLEHETEPMPAPSRAFRLRQHREIGVVDAHDARVGGLEPADQPQQCRLAGAAASHDGDELAALDRHARTVEHCLVTIALADVAELDPGVSFGVHDESYDGALVRRTALRRGQRPTRMLVSAAIAAKRAGRSASE
jgi:hypothetical protein